MDTPLGNVAEMQIRKSSGMVHDHPRAAFWVAAFWVANVLLEKAAHALHISFPSSLLGLAHIPSETFLSSSVLSLPRAYEAATDILP